MWPVLALAHVSARTVGSFASTREKVLFSSLEEFFNFFIKHCTTIPPATSTQAISGLIGC